MNAYEEFADFDGIYMYLANDLALMWSKDDEGLPGKRINVWNGGGLLISLSPYQLKGVMVEDANFLLSGMVYLMGMDDEPISAFPHKRHKNLELGDELNRYLNLYRKCELP